MIYLDELDPIQHGNLNFIGRPQNIRVFKFFLHVNFLPLFACLVLTNSYNKNDFTTNSTFTSYKMWYKATTFSKLPVSIVVDTNTVCINCAITVEESQRCKRTDGKRWQCSREAIPQEKYCGSHINRGSKRCRLSPEAATAAATLATLVTLKNGPSPTNLNTDLCILHATHPPTVLESSTSGIKWWLSSPAQTKPPAPTLFCLYLP